MMGFTFLLSRHGVGIRGEKSGNARGANKFVLKFKAKLYNTYILSHENETKTTVHNADYGHEKLCKTPDFRRGFPMWEAENGTALDRGVGV